MIIIKYRNSRIRLSRDVAPCPSYQSSVDYLGLDQYGLLRNTKAKNSLLDWSNAPGTKEVLVHVDAYQDLSFAQERNRSDLFLTAGVLCKRVRRLLSRRGG